MKITVSPLKFSAIINPLCVRRKVTVVCICVSFYSVDLYCPLDQAWYCKGLNYSATII